MAENIFSQITMIKAGIERRHAASAKTDGVPGMVFVRSRWLSLRWWSIRLSQQVCALGEKFLACYFAAGIGVLQNVDCPLWRL